jgi:integrase
MRSPSQQPAVTLGDALHALIEETTLRVAGRVRSPATLRMQRQHVAYILERVPSTVPLSEIDEQVIEALATGEGAGRRKRADGSIRPLAATTILKRLSTLRRALKIQKRRRAIERVPEFPEILAEYQPDVKFIPTFHEAERIAAELPAHRAEWFWLALWTGQHPSDVERMTREDVDLTGADAWIRVRNTKNRCFVGVRIACPAELARVLRDRWLELKTGARLVVPWGHVSSQLPAVCERLGLPRYTAKSLRHTFFTWMISRVGITKAVMEIGGWSNFDMVVKVYGHALPPQFRDAIRALDRVAIDGARRPPKKNSDGVSSAVGEEVPATGVSSTGGGRSTKPAGTSPIRIERLAVKGQSVGAERIELSTNGLRVCAPPSDRPMAPARFSPPAETTGCPAP